MKPSIKFKTATLPLLITLALLALSAAIRASCHDGCDSVLQNTFLGENALPNSNGMPAGDTALGDHALFSVFGGRYNTAVGADALYNLFDNDENSAAGYQAAFNDFGDGNTAVGAYAFFAGGAGPFEGYNTATGYSALKSSRGSYNTASGAFALANGRSQESNYNTATGAYALENNAGS